MLWNTIEFFPNAAISSPDFTMGYTVDSANKAISTIHISDSGQWTDRQIGPDEAGMWIENVKESFGRSSHFCLLAKGNLTPAATML
jgi:hypothetical protein